ncbi:MAG: dihydrofolate reductase family protein [Pseudomonadales bacterium]
MKHMEKGMAGNNCRVTIHMAMSLDGYIARKDGSVDWMETTDEFPGGEAMDADVINAFLQAIDCYVMGSHTYETALRFDDEGHGWAYGDTPVFVLTTRTLRRNRESVEFFSGNVSRLINDRLRPLYRRIWVAGGGIVAGEMLRLGLADEVSCSVLPVLIGEGVPSSTGWTVKWRCISWRLVPTRAASSSYAKK